MIRSPLAHERTTMTRYAATVRTDWEPEQAFRYLADFATVADWDPGVESAERLSDDPLAEGARVRVQASFLGRPVPLVYETTEIDSPRKVVLRAESGTVVSLDTMSFDPAPGGGTAVTYDAELTLKGPLRLFDPLMALAFRRVGDRAKEGLERRLAGPPPAGPAPSTGAPG
jgi:carbon monoxide dehydrogenase subunit G